VARFLNSLQVLALLVGMLAASFAASLVRECHIRLGSIGTALPYLPKVVAFAVVAFAVIAFAVVAVQFAAVV
jgi:hypothetical protein